MILDALLQRGPKTGDLMDPDTADAYRRIHNMLRIGTVSMLDEDLDYINGMVRVVIGDPATLKDLETTCLKTSFLRWLQPRCGPDTTWWAPEKGEQVLVLSPGGNLKRGVIIGSLYRPDMHLSPPQDVVYPQPQQRETIHYTRYADGTEVYYDRAAHLLQVNCVGSVDVNAAVKVSVEAPEIDATATVKITATAPRVNVQAATMLHITAPLVRIDGDLLVEGAVMSPSGPMWAVVPPTPPPTD